jgi:hypothetical protein
MAKHGENGAAALARVNKLLRAKKLGIDRTTTKPKRRKAAAARPAPRRAAARKPRARKRAKKRRTTKRTVVKYREGTALEKSGAEEWKEFQDTQRQRALRAAYAAKAAALATKKKK